MSSFAILAASKYGQTKKIAEYMKQWLVSSGHGVEIFLAGQLPKDLDPQTGTVIVGAPVYAGRYDSKLLSWVKDHRDDLRGLKTAFFSVSLNAADSRPACRSEDDRLLREFFSRTKWAPDFAASLAGAVKYTGYNWPIRTVMRMISKSAGGPTDTSSDHEMTDWSKVDSFLDAIVKEETEGAYALSTRLPVEQWMYATMPVFEQRWASQISVQASPARVYKAINEMDPSQLKVARILAKIRTLGAADIEAATFSEAAARFGVMPLLEEPPRAFAGGLIGKFWRKDFGIRRIEPAAFATFNDAGYSKVLTVFTIEPMPGTLNSRLRVEMRVHSTDAEALRKFAVYWNLLGAGIKLYMRSLLHAAKKTSELSSRASATSPSVNPS